MKKTKTQPPPEAPPQKRSRVRSETNTTITFSLSKSQQRLVGLMAVGENRSVSNFIQNMIDTEIARRTKAGTIPSDK